MTREKARAKRIEILKAAAETVETIARVENRNGGDALIRSNAGDARFMLSCLIQKLEEQAAR